MQTSKDYILAMKNIFVFLFLFCGLSVLYAQDVTREITSSEVPDNDVLLLYRNEQEFGVVVHSGGWGLNYRRGKHVTGYKKRVLELEFVGMKHPKEIKLKRSDIDVKGYFYGKLNAITVLRGGYGYHKVITGKNHRRGIELRLVTLAGLSFALAKPVYLKILHFEPDSNSSLSLKYTSVVEKYDPQNPLHTPNNNILGRASYFVGIGETKIYPGAFFKMGLGFEHAALDDAIKLFEIGVIIDAYAQTVPIMTNIKNNQVFVNVYLNIMLGKKWF